MCQFLQAHLKDVSCILELRQLFKFLQQHRGLIINRCDLATFFYYGIHLLPDLHLASRQGFHFSDMFLASNFGLALLFERLDTLPYEPQQIIEVAPLDLRAGFL